MSIKIKKCPNAETKGDISDFSIDNAILQKAYKNTGEMLKKEIIIEDE